MVVDICENDVLGGDFQELADRVFPEPLHSLVGCHSRRYLDGVVLIQRYGKGVVCVRVELLGESEDALPAAYADSPAVVDHGVHSQIHHAFLGIRRILAGIPGLVQDFLDRFLEFVEIGTLLYAFAQGVPVFLDIVHPVESPDSGLDSDCGCELGEMVLGSGKGHRVAEVSEEIGGSR